MLLSGLPYNFYVLNRRKIVIESTNIHDMYLHYPFASFLADETPNIFD